MALLLVLSLLFLTQEKPAEKPQDKPPEKCSLSGTVVDSVTGEPLNKVALWLGKVNVEAAMVVTTSDAKGHFALVDLDAGAYRLRGRRSGYLDGHYGARRPGVNGTIVRLEAGQALNDLNLKLTPAGVIAGTVRDSDGEPIEYASVELGQIVYSSRGSPSLVGAAYTMTDDRGEYRFHGLAAGKYYISAGYRQSSVYGQVDRSASTGPADASVATFYPAAPDPSMASPVEVSAGARITGIDVTLLRFRVVCVSGRVASPVQTGRQIVSLETANAPIGSYRESTSLRNAAGDFQFCRVPPGSYVLSAYANPLSARMPVNVSSADVNDIRMTLSPGAEIRGRVLAEGPEKPNLKDVSFEIGQDGKWLIRGDALEDGTFTIKDWRPDHYDVAIPTAPHGFYVKSIRSGEADVLADGLAIPGPGAVPLEVVLSPDGCTLGGTVVDKDQQPVAGATVLLAPDQRSRLDLFKNATTDQRGHYEFTALAPGSYKLFAWDDVTPNEWYAPGFLKDYEKQAEESVLEPKAHTTVNLRIAGPPDAQ